MRKARCLCGTREDCRAVLHFNLLEQKLFNGLGRAGGGENVPKSKTLQGLPVRTIFGDPPKAVSEEAA